MSISNPLSHVALNCAKMGALAAIVTASPIPFVSAAVVGATEGTIAYYGYFLNQRILDLTGLKSYEYGPSLVKLALLVVSVVTAWIFCSYALGLAISFKAVLMLNGIGLTLKLVSESIQSITSRAFDTFRDPSISEIRLIKELASVILATGMVFSLYNVFGAPLTLGRLALTGATLSLFTVWENHKLIPGLVDRSSQVAQSQMGVWRVSAGHRLGSE